MLQSRGLLASEAAVSPEWEDQFVQFLPSTAQELDHRANSCCRIAEIPMELDSDALTRPLDYVAGWATFPHGTVAAPVTNRIETSILKRCLGKLPQVPGKEHATQPAVALLAACSLGSITGVISVAVPDGHSGFRLEKRQDDTTPEPDLEPTDTKNLRSCKEPRPIYQDQENVEWNEVDESKTKLEVTVTTKKGEKKVPPPKDKDQGTRFVTDHVLGLIVVQSAFDDKNREYNDDAKKISDDAWKTAKEAVNGDTPDNCKKVAENITVLDNLLGIAERISLAKEAVFRKVVDDKTDTDLDSKWDDYLKAIDGYLADFKGKVEKTADKMGTALKEFTKDDKVSTYFSSFCKAKYQEGQDYLQAQLEKQRSEEVPASPEATNTPTQAVPKCSEGITHSDDDLNLIIDELKQKGNGPSNDNCCTADMGGCQQLAFNGDIGLNMCGPGQGPQKCTGCNNVADALNSLLGECEKDGRVGGKVEILDDVTLVLGLIRLSRPGRH
ncbi:MAG: hypothetical protein Q9166_004036 [cf. Caloplaca sp. 2 TL-2023]